MIGAAAANKAQRQADAQRLLARLGFQDAFKEYAKHPRFNFGYAAHHLRMTQAHHWEKPY